jgi:hypothetical protein
MAIVNMNDIFDKLQEYIDIKIDESSEALETLFKDYGMDELGPHLPEVLTVADNITDVITDANNINSIIKCAKNMVYVKACVPIAIEVGRNLEYSREARDNAFKWSSEGEDIPIDDNVNPIGYSAYHWARKAHNVVPPINGYGNGAELAITDDTQGFAEWTPFRSYVLEIKENTSIIERAGSISGDFTVSDSIVLSIPDTSVLTVV